MVGMRDVAKEAGVSLSTVSLVVNKTGYVSDDMRARVKAAMKELNYVPNELARNLYKNRTNLVGVIVPTIRPSLPPLPRICNASWPRKDCAPCCAPPPTRKTARSNTWTCCAVT